MIIILAFSVVEIRFVFAERTAGVYRINPLHCNDSVKAANDFVQCHAHIHLLQVNFTCP